LLKKGDNINNSLNWISASNLNLYTDNYSNYPNNHLQYNPGNWYNVSDGYLAFKIEKNSKTYIGWMEISLIPFHEFLIKDYAYIEE
jgi:hypothetical protein